MEKFSDIKLFRGVKMNLDCAPELLQPNEVGETNHVFEQNNSGALTNLKGFHSVMDLPINSGFTLPTGAVYRCVGTCKNIEESSIIYFLADTVGTAHGIMQLQTETKKLTWILRDEPLLNLKATYRVSANCLENLLYFTDGYFNSFLNNDFNPPRKINITKAIKYTAAYPNRWSFYVVGEASTITGDPAHLNKTAYGSLAVPTIQAADKVVAWALDGITRYKNSSGYSVVLATYTNGGTSYVITDRPWQDTDQIEVQIDGYILDYAADMYFGIDWQVMDVIKYPPTFAPTSSYDDDTQTRSNNLRGNLFQFAYRYIYDDNEKSVFSPISNVPFPTKLELTNRITDDDSTSDNVINVWMDSGPMEVKYIELAIRKGNTGNWITVNTKYKYDQDENCLLTSDIFAVYNFYNNETGGALDQADSSRPYDFVPLFAPTQEIIEKNRLLYPNYGEGFNNINIDVSLSVIQSKQTSTNPAQTAYGTYDVNSSTGHPANLLNQYIPYVALEFPSTLIPFSSYQVALYIFTEESGGSPNPGFGNITGATLYVYSLILGAQETVVDLIARMVALINVSVPFLNDPCWAVIGDNPNVLYLKYMDIFPLTGTDYPTHNINQAILTTYQPISSSATFKSGAYHFFGLDYYDRGKRCGSTNISDESQIYIPFLTETYYNAVAPNKTLIHRTRIAWEINHQPPVEATHYRWMYGLSNISYYLQLNVRAGNIIEFGEHSYLSYNEAIKNSHDALFNFIIPPYVYEKGDRMRILGIQTGDDYEYFDTIIDKEILGTTYLKYDPVTVSLIENDNEFYKVDKSIDNGGVGEFILDEKGNKVLDEGTQKIVVSKINKAANGIPIEYLGDNSLVNVIIEIYRPRKNNSDKNLTIYYGIDNVWEVKNPHTSSRCHDGDIPQQYPTVPASGTFDFGDSFVKYRITDGAVYGCEAKQFSDFYESETPGIGGANLVNINMMFQQYVANMRYSGRLIQDTRINDMSKFLGGDYISLADKYGAINHIEEVGFTLKILQKSKPSSLYIGRAGVTQPSADAKEILSSTKDVLGTLIVHDSDYGTVHGGSVVKNENRSYWFDFYAYSILRDPGNGIQNLTELYGLKKFMQDKCKLFGTAANVDVVSAYDQENELVYFSFTDKTTAANSFTVAFRDSGGRNEDGFVMFTQFIPDEYGSLKQTITAFKGNELWMMNSDTAARCNFFGTQYKYWVTVVSNKFPLTVKRWLQMLISSNKVLSCPNAGDIETPISGNSVYGGVSLLKPAAFTPVQGKWVSELGKNMTTNQATAQLADLIEGDDMEGQAITIRMEGSETVEHKILAVELQGVTT